MKNKWVIQEGDIIDEALCINPCVQRIMNIRGIETPEEAMEFISDKPQIAHDPFLMKDMEEAIDLILDKVRKGDRICIYGDYDTDGITSVSLLMEVLKNITKNVIYYLPSRFEEGYGLNCEAVKKIYEKGANLIITVDCGSVSVEEVIYARELGMEIIVSDHHTLSEEKPPCLLINPKQEECNYPFKDLCGCGVAFKIAQGLQRKAGMSKQVLKNCLDLVAIATIGDIVPIHGENRTFIKYGIKVIKKGKRKGLARMLERIGIPQNEVNSEHMAYGIVPHINAAGRMDDAAFCVELLLSEEDKKLDSYINKLIEKNTQRKKIQEKTFNQCCEIVEQNHIEDKFLLINAENAHEGVTGIVAGKIKDKYLKPTAIVTKGKDGIFKGTARSIESINIYELMSRYDGMFEKFGGHAGACGFSIKTENIYDLRKNLNYDLNKETEENPDIFTRTLKIDSEIMPQNLNNKFYDEIEMIGPFGYKNEKPLLILRKGYIQSYNYIGENASHVRFMLDFPGVKSIACILFQKAKEYEGIIHKGVRIDIVGYLEKNKFNGNINMQIRVIDLKESS